MKIKHISKLIFVLALFHSSAWADVRVNGFASFVGGITLDDDETLFGYTSDFDADPDTLVGIQGTVDLADKFTSTVQLTARGAEDYDVDLEWAYITYNYNEKTAINLGRLRVPFFSYSDFLDVRYTYYWIRPPQDVYGVLVQNITGASLLYSDSYGSWDATFQVVAGASDGETAVGDTFDSQNFFGGSVQLEKNWFSVRAGYFRNKLSINSAAFQGASDVIASTGATELASRVLTQDDTATFSHIGFKVDNGSLIINGEWRQIYFPEGLPQIPTAWYLSAGYRIGKWTPNITYEELDVALPGGNQALIDAAAPQAAAIATGLFSAFQEDRETISVGIRYEYSSNIAFKVDYTTRDDNLSSTDDADLISVGVDLLF
ncbi:hypothetical protein [Alteromonas sp. 5E99-2]|uniref:hypothetical protein n=1 Tax=Alteromonas sp. 5E99-2 TaxID=2817683 RepID=UPI001A989448|nr:hypothetical protein [Alteromonas sp. 5E99-2]